MGLGRRELIIANKNGRVKKIIRFERKPMSKCIKCGEVWDDMCVPDEILCSRCFELRKRM